MFFGADIRRRLILFQNAFTRLALRIFAFLLNRARIAFSELQRTKGRTRVFNFRMCRTSAKNRERFLYL